MSNIDDSATTDHRLAAEKRASAAAQAEAAADAYRAQLGVGDDARKAAPKGRRSKASQNEA